MSADLDSRIESHVELRSPPKPLPPPSAAARRFLTDEADPYPATKYVQPSIELEKSAALFEAQRQARVAAEQREKHEVESAC